jgi:hypothetical protein
MIPLIVSRSFTLPISERALPISERALPSPLMAWPIWILLDFATSHRS